MFTLSGKLTRPFAILFAVVTMCMSPDAFGQHYARTDLTVNAAHVSLAAPHIDPNLVNAWGLTRSSSSFWWIADNGTGQSTLYDPAGTPQSLVVKIPLPKNQNGTAAPTGAVFNYTQAFQVAAGKPALFLFVTEDGTISGWNPAVQPTSAVLKVDRSGKAIYKGCAIAQSRFGLRLYATNFKTGRVEVFDGAFHRIPTPGFAFRYPGLSNHWAPFNIQNVGGNLFVTFANRAPGSKDENHGAGLGFVGIFTPQGFLVGILQHGPWMNAPWGVALAPSDFGKFSHRVLLGNFGDGAIHAFNAVTGRFEGTLLGSDNQPLIIDGLWALNFGGNTTKSGLATDLFFTSGPNDESNGLFGKLSPVATEQRGTTE